MAAKCACAPILAWSSLAALLRTRESSSASRSVEAIGDTGLPWPSAAPARMSLPIGSAISRPTPKAKQQRQRQQPPRRTRRTGSMPAAAALDHRQRRPGCDPPARQLRDVKCMQRALALEVRGRDHALGPVPY